MALFTYIATTMDGTVVEGSIEASDEKTAVERLRSVGSIPIRITKPREGHKGLRRKQNTYGAVIPFTAELSVLLRAGIPLDKSLGIIAEVSDRPEMREMTRSILAHVSGGRSFSEALGHHPKIFSKLYVNMVRAGEASATIGQILERLNEVLTHTKELRDHVVSAMIYPAILGITGVASIIILFTFVLPKFSVIFTELGSSIPLSTRMLLAVSDIASAHWWIPVLFGVLAFLILRGYSRSEKGKYARDKLQLRLFGDAVRKLETARFCRTLGTLLRSGVALLQALDNAKDVIGNRLIASTIDEVVKGVKEGKGIATPLANAGAFPGLALSMIKAGEEAGQLDTMLLAVAAAYEEGLKQSVRRFMSLFEPAMILAMGLIIGFIVISMLMAIFSVTDLPLQ